MHRSLRTGLAIAVAAAAAACSDDPTSLDSTAFEGATLAPAFASLPGGFTDTDNSFAGVEGDAADLGRDFGRADGTDGLRDGHRDRDGHREHDLALGGGLMGGGLHGLFKGLGFGDRLGGFGPFINDCPFVADLGRVVCRPVERNGLIIERSFAFEDASGAIQEAWDSTTTDLINARVAVHGTIVRRDDAASAIAHRSDRTVAGLSEGATRRTVDGTSAGRETTTGSNDRGRYTLRRVVGDTIRGVVIPVPDETVDTRPYPVAGTVVRAMEVSLAYGDSIVRSSSRREVVTFDGSDTATLVITVNGRSKTCSLPLLYGRPVCEE